MIFLSLFAIFVSYYLYHLSQLWKPWRANVKAFGHVPGMRQFIHPHMVLAVLLPRIPYINRGYDYSYRLKYEPFLNNPYGSMCSIISAFAPARSLLLADPEAIKQVTADRTRFVKPLWMYLPLRLFGRNVGVLEGEEWRRHRRIVTSPASSEAVVRLAWQETQAVLNKCFEQWDARPGEDKEEPSAVELTLKITLFVICAVGFSLRPPWDDDEPETLEKGHKMSLRAALHGVLNFALYKISVPTWAYRFPSKTLHYVQQSYTEFSDYLDELIASRRHDLDPSSSTSTSSSPSTNTSEDSLTSTRTDLLSAMVGASNPPENGETEEGVLGKGRLSDEEVRGNMYIFLLAGHETTAHTLGFTFALLALHPSIQSHLHSTLPPSPSPLQYSDFPSLSYATAVFMETLRLYPSVIVIPKFCIEDTVITLGPKGGAKGENGERSQVVCPKGTEVLLDAPGLHHNPYYWGKDAAEFKPERFIDTPDYRWPREAFIGFSMGHRSCMGQKFGTVEATAIIATIIRDYEVLLKEDVDGTAPKGETWEQKKERVMKAQFMITLKPVPVPVVFRKRKPAPAKEEAVSKGE